MDDIAITHPCGCHSWFPPGTPKHRLDRAKQVSCSACAMPPMEGKFAARNRAAWDKSEALGLDRIEGTLSQIMWAMNIRLTLIEKFVSTSVKLNVDAAVSESLLEALLHHTDARWWIENRGLNMVAYLTSR